MAEQFVGEHISVLLKSPLNLQLRGIVGGVHDQRLTLRDAVASPGGAYYPVYVLESSQIADLQILSKPAPQASVPPVRNYAAAVSPQPFVDPAIVSMSHSVGSQQVSPTSAIPPQASIPSVLHGVEKIDIKEPKYANLPNPKTTSQTPLKGPSRPLLVPAGDNYSGKRSRRGRRPDSSAQLSGDDDMGPNYVNGSPQKLSRAGKTKVVQQLIDPDDFSRSQGTVDKTTKRKDKRTKGKNDVSNEWAGEDTADIHGLGDFDFAANLSKFDKRTVFNEIRAGDTTADEDRLVSHNRLPRPGTAGGKNYHHTENVLGGDNRSRSTLTRPGTWNKNDSSSSETERRFGSNHSRNSSRDAARPATTRNGSSRKGSAVAGTHLSATRRPQYTSSAKGSGSQRASPEPPRSKSSLRLPSNRACPVVSLLQMLDIEQNAERDYSIQEELVTENAGRNIAQMAVSMLSSSISRTATVIILAANNKSGSSALATARHILARGLRVLVCILGLERTEELQPSLTKQISIFRALGGHLSRWSEISATVKTLETPPELIIDALLGLHVPFSELRRDDQAAAFEMIKFSNASAAKKLAVDIPTGIDVLKGTVAVVDGIELVITPDVVLAIGAPKSGLLAAVEQGTGKDWVLFVTDVGLPSAAWRSTSGKRARKGIEFGREWIVKLRYSTE